MQCGRTDTEPRKYFVLGGLGDQGTSNIPIGVSCLASVMALKPTTQKAGSCSL